MTDAESPAKLSAPTFSNNSTNDAVDALPEKGRVSKSGKSSLGTPIKFAKGDNSFANQSTAPEAFNIETPTINAHRVGSS